MDARSNAWSEGHRYLLQWDAQGVVTTSAGTRPSRIRGEAVLVVHGDHGNVRGLHLDRFGLAASGVEARKSHTGVITVRGFSAAGALTFGRRKHSVRIDATCDINYESLDRAQGRDTEKGCYYVPATEPAAAVIEAQVAAGDGRPRLDSARISVSCAAGAFEEILAIELALDKATLVPIPAPGVHYRFSDKGEWTPSADSNIDSNVCVGSIRRQLIVQPVAFRSSATDLSPSGSTAAAQLATAQAVWTKSCIDFVIRSTVTLTNATLKTSSNVTDIRNAHTDTDPNVIEVFFVQNALSAQGGGTAGAIGVASCKPVIAEPNAGNPVLVAHELGHVLNLLHPGVGSNSDAGTVMAPTGSANIPGTQLVSHIMCTSIANPVLQTTTTACCFSHDIPNHYLRDFPTDLGSEPSEPLGAGMNRYAMSNVWNRRSNTPGTPSAATGPEHEHPVRFNADMTVRTNYLFARVEQLFNLAVRTAVVRFYLKHPGSGGGASNLRFLGEAAIPAGLGIGTPVNVSLAWTIPTGTPQHSCIFAVVRTDAEPEGDQSSLDWWQFETLSYNDNDWAQRNLDIENVSSSNAGDSNRVEGGPFFIQLPPARLRPSPWLTLDIDATQARPLAALSLEVVNGKTMSLDPGRRQSLRIDMRKLRERLVLVLHAEVPPGLAAGTTATVGVNPSIGKRPIVGFATQFRVSAATSIMTQTLDDAAAGFGDLAGLAELPHVNALFCAIGTGRCGRPYSGAAMVDRLAAMRSDIEGAAAEMGRLSAARQTGADAAMRRLLESLDAKGGKGGKAQVNSSIAAYRAVAKRAMMAAALLFDQEPR